jgi:hypothetical protein
VPTSGTDAALNPSESVLGRAAVVCCKTAELLLRSSSGTAQSEFVQQGGVPLVLRVVERALVELSQKPHGEPKAPVGALLQVGGWQGRSNEEMCFRCGRWARGGLCLGVMELCCDCFCGLCLVCTLVLLVLGLL